MRNLDILAAENGEHVRVLLCGEEQSYVVSCQHFRMPYPVASELLAELQPVPAEAYSVFVLDEDITNRQREGRNRKLDLIAPLLEDACIYDKSHRNEIVRQIAAEHNIARRTVLQYLWRYWVYQSKNALLPAERPAPEQHELTTDEQVLLHPAAAELADRLQNDAAGEILRCTRHIEAGISHVLAVPLFLS